MTTISLIWAEDAQQLIGNHHQLPWKLPADMQWFRRQTMGKPILMGRKTFASIGKALPGRTNLVLTREKGLKIEGCSVVHSFDEAQDMVADAAEMMVIGGAEIYALALPVAGRLYMTQIKHSFTGDTWFPAFDRRHWHCSFHESHHPDDKNAYSYDFSILER